MNKKLFVVFAAVLISLVGSSSGVNTQDGQRVPDQEAVNSVNEEKQTISYYDQEAVQWIARYGPEINASYWTDELAFFQTYLPHGHILEIGFGAAGEAAEFIKNGYTYTGIDPAAAFVKIAQKRFPQATFIEKNVYNVDFPKATFDGFWCAAVFLHISKQNIDLALQKIKYVLKPGACGFISLVKGCGKYFDATTKRYFYLYTEEEFASILRKNGFVIIKTNVHTKNPQPTWWPWLKFFVRV